MPKVTGPEAREIFDGLIDKHDQRLAKSIRRVLNELHTRVDVDEIAALIRTGDAAGIQRLITVRRAWQAVDGLFAALSSASRDGGRATTDIQGPIPTFGGETIEITTRQTNPVLDTYAEAVTAAKVREINDVSLLMMREKITEGLGRGDDPFAIARKVKDGLGITRHQSRHVDRYRARLEALDPSVLESNLRDARHDGPIRRAIDNAEPISRDKIDKYVERYRQGWVQYRSQVIGRTEAIRAVQGAQYLLFEDLVNKGQIDRRQIRRHWIVTHDDNLRNSHREIPHLNPDGVGQGEPFQTPLGPMLYPGDPNGVPANTIQCRCAAFVEVISAELLGITRPDNPPEGVLTNPADVV